MTSSPHETEGSKRWNQSTRSASCRCTCALSAAVDGRCSGSIPAGQRSPSRCEPGLAPRSAPPGGTSSALPPGSDTSDLLRRLAHRYVYAPLWSADLQAEWMRSLLSDRSDIDTGVLDKTRAVRDLILSRCRCDGIREHCYRALSAGRRRPPCPCRDDPETSGGDRDPKPEGLPARQAPHALAVDNAAHNAIAISCIPAGCSSEPVNPVCLTSLTNHRRTKR